MAFSASDSAFEGFRLARRTPLTILIWAVFSIVMIVAILAVAGAPLAALMQEAQSMQGSSEPTPEFMAAYFGFLGMIFPLSLIFGSIFYAAINRAVVRPAESAVGYLRLGMDEVRVLVTQLALAVIFGLGFGLIVGVGAAIIGAIAAIGGEGGAGLAALLGFVLYIGFLALVVWVAVRMSLVLPITIAERRFAIFDSWKMTKGHFWSLLGMNLLAWVMGVVVQILVSIVLLPILFFAMGGFDNLEQLSLMAPAEIFQTMAPFAIIALVGYALLTALLSAIMYAPSGSAYLALKGSGGGTAAVPPTA